MSGGKLPHNAHAQGGPEILVMRHLGKLRCWNVAPGNHPPLFDDGGFREREEKRGSFEPSEDNNLLPFSRGGAKHAARGSWKRDLLGGEQGYL